MRGTLLAESLAPGITLDLPRVVVSRIERSNPRGPEQQGPPVWTAIEFEGDDGAATEIAAALAQVLDEPGWYANFSTAGETFVVYRGQIFGYRRGDPQGRAEAQAYGRSRGVPERELDWTE